MQQPAQNIENKIKELWPKNGPSSLEVEKYIKKTRINTYCHSWWRTKNKKKAR